MNLMVARDERRLRKLQNYLVSVKRLIIGELCYVPLTAVGAKLLLEMLNQRYKRRALLNRLTHHGNNLV